MINYNPYQQYYPQYQQPQQPQQTQQIQNSGCVSVWAEEEARIYPIARGTSVTFRDETAPYIYTKSMGFSPQDHPIFEKYKRVDDEHEEPKPKLEDEITALWDEINALKDTKKPTTTRKKEDGGA